jgi:hypothetical protein
MGIATAPLILVGSKKALSEEPVKPDGGMQLIHLCNF